jgi:hypothetical protein
MPKFSVKNLADKAVDLVIEPWADVFVLAPDGCADFQYDEPGEVEFLLQPGGGALVFVASGRLKYSANGRTEEWEDKTGFLASLISARD